jgi:GTP-binding protein Era
MEEELYVLEDLPEDHRSGFVAVVGKPNVGKSTLMNALLGQKIAIVSPKPQTTRTQILGILTRPEAQIVFMDTPGLHKPQHKLGEYMVETAERAIPDADLVAFLVDATKPPTQADTAIADMLAEVEQPLLLVLNKVDAVNPEAFERIAQSYRALADFEAEVAVSALTGRALASLLETMIDILPRGPRYFPEEQVTDQMERFIVAELVREQVLDKLRQEVPHAVAVVVEQFKERPEGKIYVEANVYVEKESQKGILIGRGGRMLKRIGRDARKEIEDFLQAPVYLDLWVKVLKNWRKKDHLLRRLGYGSSKRPT